MPPRKPSKAGNALSKAKPGLMMKRLPIKAAITQMVCVGVTFSFKNKKENRITKNGDSLFSIEASARFNCPIA